MYPVLKGSIGIVNSILFLNIQSVHTLEVLTSIVFRPDMKPNALRLSPSAATITWISRC